MAFHSPRARKLQERDETILNHARAIFLVEGYYGLTMDRIAAECGVSKGTIYHYFSCKEEVLVALADNAMMRRNAMMSRGAAFRGRTRERVLAIGEAIGLFVLVHSGDSRIIHATMGPLREKTPPLRLKSLMHSEQEALGMLRGVIQEAIAAGDLVLREGTSVQEILLGSWGLVDGAHALVESGASASLELPDPLDSVWRFWNFAADGYGWRPLFTEWDYAETLARARREVFAEEAKLVYGESYGVRR